MKQSTTKERQEVVYLLHFTTSYKHAKHYLGSTQDLNARLAAHSSGAGARLMEVIRDAGINFVLARTWKGGRDLERRLKNQHSGVRLCPICKEKRPAFPYKPGKRRPMTERPVFFYDRTQAIAC